MTDTRYVRVVPNSHSFMSLDNILASWEFKPQELTKDYLLIGFKNTLDCGVEIEKVDNTKKDLPIIFKSIFDITQLIEEDENMGLSMFVGIIKSTIESGYDLRQKNTIDMNMNEE